MSRWDKKGVERRRLFVLIKAFGIKLVLGFRGTGLRLQGDWS